MKRIPYMFIRSIISRVVRSTGFLAGELAKNLWIWIEDEPKEYKQSFQIIQYTHRKEPYFYNGQE